MIGDAGDVAQAVSVTGDITLSSGGVVAISTGVIVNADINASAAIDATKIANGSVSNTEFQFLDGVTSAIQTQLNTKLTIGGDTKGADISVGTNDNYGVNVLINSNVGLAITAGRFVGIRKSDPQSALHILGNGSNGANNYIFFGDSFNNTGTPYAAIGENNGTDSDALEAYGKNGFFVRVATFGSTAKLCVTSTGAVCVNTETAVSGAELTVNGDVDISQTLNVQSNGTFTGHVKYKATGTPSAPASAAEFNLYYRANKFIIQYNDVGTTRYKYLDLNGTGVTWVHTTVAP